MKKYLFRFLTIILVTLALFPSCDLSFFKGFGSDAREEENKETTTESGIDAILSHQDVITAAMDEDTFFILYNEGVPNFSDEDKNNGEYYISLSDLDELGRVGIAIGLFDAEHFPSYERESLSTKPTGWVQKRYDWVESRWLYNRAHLLGFQYSGLQDEAKNLMTGTRSFNVDGMLPYENILSDHMREEDGSNGEMHQVLVRITPDFYSDNLLAHGIIMEADCIDCDDIDFAVYIPNWEPGVTIDYRSGENWANGDDVTPSEEIAEENATYILNTNTLKFHELDCKGAPKPDSANYKLTDLSYAELIDGGYSPCGTCKPSASLVAFVSPLLSA